MDRALTPYETRQNQVLRFPETISSITYGHGSVIFHDLDEITFAKYVMKTAFHCANDGGACFYREPRHLGSTYEKQRKGQKLRARWHGHSTKNVASSRPHQSSQSPLKLESFISMLIISTYCETTTPTIYFPTKPRGVENVASQFEREGGVQPELRE